MRIWKKIKEKWIYISWVVLTIITVLLNITYEWPCSLIEWFDFLLAIVPPVALMILILGYRYRHQKEKLKLKLNTKQLKDQYEELKE